MDLKVKLLIGLGGAGATGGAGIVAYPYLSKTTKKESILTIITNQGERFILSTSGTNHDTQWSEIVKEIENKPDAKQEIGDPINENKLKTWCKGVLDKKIYKDDLVNKFKFRCTRNTVLTEVKSKLISGKSIINFGDNEGWTTSYNNYKSQATTGELQITIGSTKISNTEMSSKKADDIRDWCQSMKNSLFVSSSDSIYTLFNKWCVKG